MCRWKGNIEKDPKICVVVCGPDCWDSHSRECNCCEDGEENSIDLKWRENFTG